MEIDLKEISIRELAKDYEDLDDDGVTAYGGKLTIRPPYQREFIYGDKERDAVMHTILRASPTPNKHFPINVMYWAVNDDEQYEVIDGQQRIISICQFINLEYSIKHRGKVRLFSDLPKEDQEYVYEYPLMVYFCDGNEDEKMEWFELINIAGKPLTKQELRNATYHGEFVTEAKRHFSRPREAMAYYGKDYIGGNAKRQEVLETVLRWKVGKEERIDQFMSKNRKSAKAAKKLYKEVLPVIDWAKETFPGKRPEMKKVNWWDLHAKYKHMEFDKDELKKQIDELMSLDTITHKQGIYPYVLGGQKDDTLLHIRSFKDEDKNKKFDEQGGRCALCNKEIERGQATGDHITPWKEKGPSTYSNLQILCFKCNLKKSSKLIV